MSGRTARSLLADATHRLERAGIDSASVDAALLLSHVLGVPRGRLMLLDEVTDDARREFERVLTRRLARVPLQHLTGQAPFRHLVLMVGPGVFIPRPETELLAEVGIRRAREMAAEQQRRITVVDLCTGSAAVALAVATECRNVDVHAVELSPEAYVWAQRNVDAHREAMQQQGSTLTLHHGDATHADELLRDHLGRVDIVLSNPPYIPDAATPIDPEVSLHDPPMALYGGADGLDVVRDLEHVAAHLLIPDGLVAIEHADAQGTAAGPAGVPRLLGATGRWSEIRDLEDLTGRPRVTVARLGHNGAS